MITVWKLLARDFAIGVGIVAAVLVGKRMVSSTMSGDVAVAPLPPLDR